MKERTVRQDLRINVLRADEVGVWHCMLRLAAELAAPAPPLRSVPLGRFEFVAADGRTGSFSAELMAEVLELSPPLVASTIDKLLELKILTLDGNTLCIESAEDWFIPLTEHPPFRN